MSFLRRVALLAAHFFDAFSMFDGRRGFTRFKASCPSTLCNTCSSISIASITLKTLWGILVPINRRFCTSPGDS